MDAPLRPLPQAPRLEYPKITKGLRPSTDERKSGWVVFPHLRGQYLLPVLRRSRKLKPIQYEDGSIGWEVEEPDPSLGQMADEFIVGIARQQAESDMVTVTVQGYGNFIKLVKGLLLKNYDFTDEQVLKMLETTEREFATLNEIIFMHCFGA